MIDRKTAGPVIPRRRLLQGTAAGAAVGLIGVKLRPAAAQEVTMRGYGTSAQGLEDWTPFVEATGMEMRYTPTVGDPGVVLREIMANEIGRDYDFFLTEVGMQTVLGEDWFLPLDTSHPALTLWDRVPEAFTAPLRVGDVQYGVPNVGGADSFGFWPDALGVDDPTETLSWKLMFDSEETLGRVGLSTTMVYSFPLMAQYVHNAGIHQIADVTNLSAEEARAVADFGIARKQAGQFRAFFVGFDEQVQLLGNREVDILNCWSDAVVVVNEQQGGEVVHYANADYYFKWGNALFVPIQAAERDNLDRIYETLNFFLSGAYLAPMGRKGLAGPNMDLAVAYAEEQGWPAEDVAKIGAVGDTVARKYETPQFSFNPVPPNLAVMEEEWQRFLNA
ncbi:MAG: PotD/PotF family extracellular solute-binding protein [Azospirillaceae bacterium]